MICVGKLKDETYYYLYVSFKISKYFVFDTFVYFVTFILGKKINALSRLYICDHYHLTNKRHQVAT